MEVADIGMRGFSYPNFFFQEKRNGLFNLQIRTLLQITQHKFKINCPTLTQDFSKLKEIQLVISLVVSEMNEKAQLEHFCPASRVLVNIL